MMPDAPNAVTRPTATHLDEERIRLELRRIDSDLRMRKWTILAVVAPVLLGLGTLWFQIWTQYQQAQREFALRAVEIVASAKNSYEVADRLKQIEALFPGALPTKLGDFKPRELDNGPGYESRLNFLRLMVDGGQDAETISRMYGALFPRSPIPGAVAGVLRSASPAQQQPAADGAARRR